MMTSLSWPWNASTVFTVTCGSGRDDADLRGAHTMLEKAPHNVAGGAGLDLVVQTLCGPAHFSALLKSNKNKWAQSWKQRPALGLRHPVHQRAVVEQVRGKVSDDRMASVLRSQLDRYVATRKPHEEARDQRRAARILFPGFTSILGEDGRQLLRISHQKCPVRFGGNQGKQRLRLDALGRLVQKHHGESARQKCSILSACASHPNHMRLGRGRVVCFRCFRNKGL
eukprot:scaffold3388_cov264-Pinguiococcus_pyrenoidosus.AAC.6